MPIPQRLYNMYRLLRLQKDFCILKLFVVFFGTVRQNCFSIVGDYYRTGVIKAVHQLNRLLTSQNESRG